jgi:ribulose-5-phosphate 4-epimerase/fuculose-1-phosphate aldolase
VPLVDYVAPGEPVMGDLIRALGGAHAAVLLANHGPVVSGPNLESAVYAAEELEETAKLAIMLRAAETRELTPQQIAELEAKFALR